MSKFLEMNNICKYFGGVKALQNVDFTMDYGEIRCLVGENGSGKSTLIKIISGVHKPEDGSKINFDGKNIHHMNSRESVRLGIQVIYQDLSLFPTLSVAENICFSDNIESGKKLVNFKKAVKKTEEVLKQLGIEINPKKKITELSIAERQLVAIARAIAAEAKLVIMDEPTASLTKKEVEVLLGIIKDLQSKKVSTIFVSHKLDEVMSIAESVTVLRDGKKVGDYKASELDNDKLAFLMTGKKFKKEVLPEYRTNDEKPLLQILNLTKKDNYRDVSIDLYKGEIVGIIGLLGSGRTEMALSLFGINKPDSGQIILENEEIKIKSIDDAIKYGIGYVPEDRLSLGLVMEQSVSKNMILPILERISKHGIIDIELQKNEVEQSVGSLKIKIPSFDAPVKTLSGGNQQRVVLGKWIGINPKILILDSPTVGVDVAAKASIYEIIKKLAFQGMGIIMISDEVEEILYNTNTIYTMASGRITGKFNSADLSERELYEETNKHH